MPRAEPKTVAWAIPESSAAPAMESITLRANETSPLEQPTSMQVGFTRSTSYAGQNRVQINFDLEEGRRKAARALVVQVSRVRAIHASRRDESGERGSENAEPCRLQSGQRRDWHGRRVGAIGVRGLKFGFARRSGILLTMVRAAPPTASMDSGKLGGSQEGIENSGPNHKKRKVG